MKSDERGFFYPQINHQLCTQCGACDKVCERRMVKKVEETFPLAYGAYAKDLTLRMESSSGGVFSILAENVLRADGVVIGAAMSKDCYHVEHIIVTNKEQLGMLRGSKYVQSRVNGLYTKVREYLATGRKVLFSGTPCQVDGLKAYLNKEYDNLLCVDIICHGVPSELIWQKYCREIETSTGKKITAINFRHKKYSWERLRSSINSDNNNNIYSAKSQDPYLRLFLQNYGLRPSCYYCQHKGLNRNSDITLADFWGIGKIIPSFSDGKGVSLILCQSRKGEDAISSISDKLVIKDTNAAKAIDGNISGLEAGECPKQAEQFWLDSNEMSVKELANKYAPISRKQRIKLCIIKVPIYRIIRTLSKGGRSFNMEYGIRFDMSAVNPFKDNS